MKKTMKDALKQSLKTEEQRIEERFSKAEGIFTSPIEKEPETIIKKISDPLIRDTFSMPKKDNDLIGEVKMRCMRAGVDTTKSEIVRAGIRQLAKLPADELCRLVESVEKLKPGPQKQEKR
jgi:hypothetical protein